MDLVQCNSTHGTSKVLVKSLECPVLDSFLWSTQRTRQLDKGLSIASNYDNYDYKKSCGTIFLPSIQLFYLVYPLPPSKGYQCRLCIVVYCVLLYYANHRLKILSFIHVCGKAHSHIIRVIICLCVAPMEYFMDRPTHFASSTRKSYYSLVIVPNIMGTFMIPCMFSLAILHKQAVTSICRLGTVTLVKPFQFQLT